MIKKYKSIDSLKTLKETHKTRIEFFSLSGEKYVRKTVKGKFSKIICSREVKALERLKGIKSVQELVEQDSDNSFISKFVNGTSIYNYKDFNKNIFNDLEILLEEMKSRGIADFDFGNKNDWIITNKGEIILIDFAASVFDDDFILNNLLDFGINIGYVSLYKYKSKILGYNELTKKEKEYLKYYDWILKLNRNIKKIRKGIKFIL